LRAVVTYQNPFPALAVVDEARDDRSKEIASCQEECIESNVGSSLMGKELI
jgi:hypothetical protein